MEFLILVGGIFVAFLLIGVLSTALADEDKKYAEQINKEKLESLVKELNIEGTSFTSYNYTCSVILDEKDREIHIFHSTGADKNDNLSYEHQKCAFDEMLESEVIIDNESITKTMRGRQIGSMVAGGALLGGVGAIVGGLSGGTKSETRINNIDIKLTINNINNPIQKINFLNTFQPEFSAINAKNGFKKDSEQYKQAILEVEKWQGIFDVILNEQQTKSATQ